MIRVCGKKQREREKSQKKDENENMNCNWKNMRLKSKTINKGDQTKTKVYEIMNSAKHKQELHTI